MVLYCIEDTSKTTSFATYFRNCIFQNLTFLKHQRKNMTMSSFFFFFFFFPGRDQYYSRLFLRVCCPGSTRRLSREVGLLLILEKPGIEPAIPGLQGE